MKKLNSFVSLCIMVMLLSSCQSNTTNQKIIEKVCEPGTEKITEPFEYETDSITAELDYDTILDGDFSSVAGVYEYPNGNTFEILNDGTHAGNVAVNDLYEGREIRIENIKKNTDETYMWDESCYFEGEYMDGVACILYPVGVEVVTYDGKVLDTDISKIRYWSGQDSVAFEEYIAYKTDDVFEEDQYEKLVIDYFTNTYPADGDYVVFDFETMKDDDCYTMTVRFQPNYETMEANQFVEMVDVERTTAKMFINGEFVCKLN